METCHLWSPVVTCVAPWIVAAPQAWPGPLRRCFVQRPGCRDFPCWTCAGMIHAPQHSWRHGFFRRFPEVPGGSQGKCPNRPRISDPLMIVLLAFLVRPFLVDVLCFDSLRCCDWVGDSCTAQKNCTWKTLDRLTQYKGTYLGPKPSIHMISENGKGWGPHDQTL